MFRTLFWVVLVLTPVYGDDPALEPRMVDLNVVAIDSHGQAVNDLTREEFRVSDAGKPQTIAFFRHRTSDRLQQAPTLGPNEFSNRSRGNIPHATLILFDMMNERFGTRGTSANQLVHDIESLESPDFVYLYLLTIDGHIFPVHGLPSEHDETSPADGVSWTRHVKPLMEQAMRTVTQLRPIDMDVAVREQLTYMALSGIAVELSKIPGRKSIVWLTDGVPIELGPYRSDTGDYVDFTPLLKQMSEAFDRSGVAIYPVRQVMLGSPEGMGGPNATGAGSLDTLNLFAEMTGGRRDAGKDIGAAVRQAINDMRTSYQMAYYPPENNWDDRFHKLRVICTRKGVRIQAKTSYYAWREAPGARSEQAIESATSTNFDAAEIGLRATLLRDANGGRTVRIEAHIDAQDIVLVHEGDWYNGDLRLAVVGYVPGDRAQYGPVIPLELHYSAEDRDRALQQGIVFDRNVTLVEGMRSVRLIVFDRSSNAIGSVTIPVP